MKAFPRFLITAILGLPGCLMWFGGFATWMFLSIEFIQENRFTPFQRIMAAAGAIGACLIGFLMLSAVGIMTGAPRYRIPNKLLLQCMGFEFLVLLLWMLFMGGVVTTLLELGMGRSVVAWIAYDLAVLAGLLATVRFQRSHGRKRAAEALHEARSRLERDPG